MTKNDSAAPTGVDPGADAPPEKVKRAKKTKVYAVEPSRHPYTPLGYNHGTFYYLSHASRQVIALPGPAHSMANLLQLASLDYWEAMYPGRTKVPLEMAQNYLFAQCYKKGIYDHSMLRGRGAWFDDGRSVLHCGNRLIVDGVEAGIAQFQSDTNFIYEAAYPLGVRMENRLKPIQSSKFADLCARLNWGKPIHARYLSGWCVLSIICGALAWRPHLFISGGSGAGKSWAMRELAGRVLDGFAIKVSATTSEAGLRQTLAGDALPVIFDDTDPDSKADMQRMQNVLGLMRACSTDDSGLTIKGSGDGNAVRYNMRSCFICSAVGDPITKQTDKTRIEVLKLEPSKLPMAQAKAAFELLENDAADLLTDDFIRAFQSRAIHMIPIIRKNARTFASAAAMAIGTQRLGDQIGALLAGAHSLFSDNLITPQAAKKWVEEQDWTDDIATAKEKEEIKLCDYLSQLNIRTDHGERSVTHLIHIAQGEPGGKLTADDAYETLRRYGMMLRVGQKIAFANNNPNLAKLLENTAWPVNWNKHLSRLPGAEQGDVARFGPKDRQRTMAIPVRVFLGLPEAIAPVEQMPLAQREPGSDDDV
jgi:putative DNA primase/helicase